MSTRCRHSAKFVAELGQASGMTAATTIVDIDTARAIPPQVTGVPAIAIASTGQIYVGTRAFAWLKHEQNKDLDTAQQRYAWSKGSEDFGFSEISEVGAGGTWMRQDAFAGLGEETRAPQSSTDSSMTDLIQRRNASLHR